MEGTAWIDRLAASDLVLLDDFLGADVAAAVRAEVQDIFAAGLGRPARVGRGEGEGYLPDTRRDLIHWFEDVAQPPAIAGFLARMEALRQTLNREAFLGLRRLECHAAYYGPGAFYKAHLDAFADGSNRLITFVYFLNPGWGPAHGGQLQLLGPHACVIEPRMDRLVLFKSREVLHEVLPSHADRYTLTGWMYGVDEERRRRGGVLGDLL